MTAVLRFLGREWTTFRRPVPSGVLGSRPVGPYRDPGPLRILVTLLKNWPKVRLYTGKICMREMSTELLLLSQAGQAYYLYSEIATYDSSGREAKETVWKTREDK